MFKERLKKLRLYQILQSEITKFVFNLTDIKAKLFIDKTRHCQEDLPRAVTDRDGWQERVKEIPAVSMLLMIMRSICVIKAMNTERLQFHSKEMHNK